MSDTPPRGPTDDERLADVVQREGSRLRRFVRRRVADPRDVEDILQDVFYALVKANRLLMPIEHVTGWLFRAARNRIIDLYRLRTTEPLELEDLLPSPGAGPEDEYARALLLEALEEAIAELPAERRDARGPLGPARSGSGDSVSMTHRHSYTRPRRWSPPCWSYGTSRSDFQGVLPLTT